MDGVCEVLGTDPEVTWEVGDRVFRLSMLTVDDWGEITNEVRKNRPDPVALGLRMVAGLENREDRVTILQQAWGEARKSQIVPQKEVFEWTTTPEGACFAMWKALQNRHPDLTLKEVRAMVRPVAQAGRGISHGEIVDLIDQVHGMPPTGPT